MRHERPAAALRFDASELQYTVDSEILWRFGVSELAVCGEYTTEFDLWADDYFLVFVTLDGRCYAACWDDASDAFRHGLAQRCGFRLEPGLANQVEFSSRVIWPDTMRGGPLLDLAERPNGTWIRRLADRLLGTRDIVLAQRVVEHLAEKQRERA